MKLSRAVLRQRRAAFSVPFCSFPSSSLPFSPPRPSPARPSCRRASWLSWGKRYTTVSAADLEFGQPVYETHPHLLKPGEITPGISAQEYFDRRARLAVGLQDGGVAILAAADVKYRSGAVFFPFRQESNFLYLTGFAEPDAVAVIRKTGPRLGDYAFHLFCRPKDPRAEQWSGPWSGLQAARDVFNADEAADVRELVSLLSPLVRSASRVYTDATAGSLADVIVRGRAGSDAGTQPLAPLVHELRAIKSAAEIANMREAGRASGRAITEAMRRDWRTERELAAFLDYQFVVNGCDGPAYVPVVAGGARGRMIHYVHNNASLQADDMMLVDAGGEHGTYVADITRTWPLCGRFSAARRDLYEAVLRVQRTGVALCRQSAGLSLDQIHRATEDGLRDQLSRLGFSFADGPAGRAALVELFPHHVGHYVGLDIHDTPGYSRSQPLKAGHCVTVEPGVYVPDDDRWPAHFRGMAVRIEDSVCVGDDSPLVLTTEAVKEVADIEGLR